MLAGALIIIAVGVTAMVAALPGASALLVVSVSLLALVPALKMLGSMKLSEIGKSLIMLAGAFVVFGVASTVLSPLAPVLLTLAGAIALFGFAVLTTGVGILAFSAGLASLAISGTAGIAVLVAAIEMVIGLIPTIVVKLAEGFISILKIIGDSAEQICKTVVQIGKAIIDSLIELLPKIIEFILKILDAIGTNSEPIINLIIDILEKIIYTIISRLPEIVQMGIDLIVGFINGLSTGIVDNAERIRDAFVNLFKSILEAIFIFLGMDKEKSKEFVDIAFKIVKSIVKGIVENAILIIKVIKTCIKDMLEVFKKALSKFKEVGKNIIEGIGNGIKSAKDKVVNGVKDICNSIKEKFTSMFDMHSPSKVTEKYGEYIDEGLSNGLIKMSNLVANSAEKVGDEVTNNMLKTIEDISGITNDNVNYEPVITPSLNLNQIRSDADEMKSILNNDGIIDTNIKDFNDMIESRFDFSTLKGMNNDVVKAINELRADTISLGNRIEHLQLMLDTGALVGHLTPQINNAFGRMAVYSERGN